MFSRTGAGRSAGLSFPSVAFAVADFLIERANAELVQSTFLEIAGAFQTGDLPMLLRNTRIYSRARKRSAIAPSCRRSGCL